MDAGGRSGSQPYGKDTVVADDDAVDDWEDAGIATIGCCTM